MACRPTTTVGERVDCDVLVVGAGAAGLATAIFAARAGPHLQVRCVDGAARIGAKILVSGGSRCNVTNRCVSEHDFWGGSTRTVRRVLQAFPASRVVDWFEDMGVPLHEEEGGKLFPNTNRARTVLDALVGQARLHRVRIDVGRRVQDIQQTAQHFVVSCGDGATYRSRAVVLATGGRSLPKTGSDGLGYELARRLGHGLVETTPALAPLVLGSGECRVLAGVSHPAALTLWVGGRATIRLAGPLLWTHAGVSGPVVLNLSRHWHRARLGTDPSAVETRLSVCPEETFESLDRWLLEQAGHKPRAKLTTVLSARLPAAVAEVWVRAAGLSADQTLAHIARDDWRRVARGLVETPLEVRDSLGYQYAEVTAGGVPLAQVDAATMASRVCPGLFLVGEILDVDGRLGGFNFQWAWASGWVAGRGVVAYLAEAGQGARSDPRRNPRSQEE